jgi:hypothetical protein
VCLSAVVVGSMHCTAEVNLLLRCFYSPILLNLFGLFSYKCPDLSTEANRSTIPRLELLLQLNMT